MRNNLMRLYKDFFTDYMQDEARITHRLKEENAWFIIPQIKLMDNKDYDCFVYRYFCMVVKSDVNLINVENVRRRHLWRVDGDREWYSSVLNAEYDTELFPTAVLEKKLLGKDERTRASDGIFRKAKIYRLMTDADEKVTRYLDSEALNYYMGRATGKGKFQYTYTESDFIYRTNRDDRMCPVCVYEEYDSIVPYGFILPFIPKDGDFIKEEKE